MMSVTAGCFSVVAIMPRWICNVVLMTMLAVQNPSAASSDVSSLDRRLATEGPVRLGILSTIGELSSTEVFSETVHEHGILLWRTALTQRIFTTT